MRMHSFIRGMGIGTVVGAAVIIGMSMSPKQRREVKKGALRCARTIGDAVEDMGGTLGM